MTTPHPPRPGRPAIRDAAPVQASVAVEVSPADLIAAAVLACPSVAGLHGGRFGEVATYLPGRRVTGVRVAPGEVVVHLIGRYPVPVIDLDAQVRAAVHPHLGGRPLTVVVEDYAEATTTPTDPDHTASPPPTATAVAVAQPSATPPPAGRGITADVTKEIL